MKSTAKFALIGFGVVILLLAAWKFYGISSAADPRRQNVPIVKSEPVHRETLRYTLRFTGDVIPIQQANIYAKVSGNLERIYADMGTGVRENQLLALIDTTELSQQFAQASATYMNAKLNYERTKELSEQNLVAKQDLDNAYASMKVAKANNDAAETRLGYASIRAPFAGSVTRRFLDPGANVTSNSTTLFTLMDLHAMKILVNVLEKDIPSISTGKKAVISVDAHPGKQFYGSITRLSHAVDLSTRTMAVEIDIPNDEMLLAPGMYASVSLLVRERPNALTVPTQAILKDEKGDYVYIIEGEVARRRPISSGAEQETRTEVLAGLTGAEQLITVGQQFVKDGTKVSVQQ